MSKKIIYVNKSQGALILTDNNIENLKKIIDFGETFVAKGKVKLTLKSMSKQIDIPDTTFRELMYKLDGHESFVIKGEKIPFRKKIFYLEQYTLPKKTFHYPVWINFVKENLV